MWKLSFDFTVRFNFCKHYWLEMIDKIRCRPCSFLYRYDSDNDGRQTTMAMIEQDGSDGAIRYRWTKKRRSRYTQRVSLEKGVSIRDVTYNTGDYFDCFCLCRRYFALCHSYFALSRSISLRFINEHGRNIYYPFYNH